VKARSILRAMAMAIAAVLLHAPAVAADTCCANVPVQPEPGSAKAGDTVTLLGMECRDADNSGPRPLELGSFWLAATDRPAEPDPDTTPGAGLPAELPPVEEWLPFDTVPDGMVGPGDATITVPALPNGRYQLWWWCDDGSGPGGGIHYSTGPRLAIGVPDTATAIAAVPEGPADAGWPTWPALMLGLGVFVWSLRHPLVRDHGRRSGR
jgi:hypothetical protein